MTTKAWVLHPDIQTDRDRREAQPALDEAISLAHALPGLEVAGGQIVRLPRAHPGHLFGTGKMDELKNRIEAEEIGLVLIDGPVSPVQQRNLEKAWGVKLLDRTGLILEIFSDRAATREGVLQVEMAHLSYQRTRLVRAWTHLERQRGGLGFVGGPGETQIEADRRAIDEQIVRLKKQLDKVVKTRELHRAARAKVPFPIVALVGYTNAGKSTLFNRLTGAEVMAEDMLFATLDPTMRAIGLPGVEKAILSDTVGFISDLPTQLVAAFRATLEEVTNADLILHVRDIANPSSAAQKTQVLEVLHGLGVVGAMDEGAEEAGEEAHVIPIVEVWNKWDLLDDDARENLLARAGEDDAVVPLSAETGFNVDALEAAVAKVLMRGASVREFVLPTSAGREIAWLHAHGDVLEEEEIAREGEAPQHRLVVRLGPKELGQFESFGVA